MNRSRIYLLACSLAVALMFSSTVLSQSLRTAGTVSGVVADPNGAVVPNANLAISNPITGYKRTVTAGADGSFRFTDVPPNNYQLSVEASGFQPEQQAVNVRTAVPIDLKITLSVGGTTESVSINEVITTDVLENIPSSHRDLDQSLIKRLPTNRLSRASASLISSSRRARSFVARTRAPSRRPTTKTSCSRTPPASTV
jgi:hypothetical protein